MKRICLILSLTALAALTFGAGAQDRKPSWKEKMQNEMIAFLTTEMDLTPAEAQIFWPVYNQVNKQRDAAHREVMTAYKKLSETIDSDRSEKEIESALVKYLEALDRVREIDSGAAGEYKSILPASKVAKLYRGEEKFRRSQICKLHNR